MGAPIYLVSACTSGEEFVAAFRRYADKNGLFIPISEPLPPGGRSRFAVTLRDGGVMIEGEAEIVSSARMPSVLHGRVGMTLRFVEPDEASQTMLGELVKARLAMKPAPPSIAPRPAQIPAEPRPVPPPAQGRIDAVNALAECVAIGDTSALGPALPTAAAPSKASQRFAIPAIPSGRSAPGTIPPGGFGLTARTQAASRAQVARPPLPVAAPDAKPEARTEAEVPPPTITPRATPLSGRLRSAELPTASPPPPDAPAAPAAPAPSRLSESITAVKSIEAGPTSETMIAATPPPPSSSPPPPPGTTSATMTAVPTASPASPSSPTEIGGVLVDPLPALEPGAASSPAIVVPIATEDDPSARTQIHAGAPRPMVPPAAAVTAAAARRATPDLGTPQTLPGLLLTSLPGSPQPLPEGAELSDRVTASITMHGMEPLSRPPAAALLTDLDDAEIAEPTDISMPPEPPNARALATEIMPPLEAEPGASPPEPDAEPDAEPEAGPSAQRPRRTAVGVVVVPPGVVVLPATPTLPIPVARAAGEEVTGPDERRIVVGRGAVDTGAPTIPPMPELSAANEESTPSEIWITAPAVPPSVAPPAAPIAPPAAPIAPPAAPIAPLAAPLTPAAANALPSGDWMIARDPEAPDGWSDPFETLSSPSTPLIGGAPPAEPAPPPAPLPGELPIVAPPPPVDAAPRRPSQPVEPPMTEPKVQIDPTLIEPIHGAMSIGEPLAAAPSHDMAMYGAEPPQSSFEAPALQMMMAVPQPGPYASPHGHPLMHAGQVAAYPLDPSYAMPAAIPTTPSSPGMPLAGGAFGDPRYASDPAMQAQVRRRHLIIVLASAVVAALLGIAIMLVFHGRRAPEPAAPAPPPSGADPSQIEPGAPSPTTTPAAADPSGPPAPPAAPSPDHAAASAGQPAAPSTTAAASPPPVANSCFAEVSSLPSGADIVVDQNTVIGTTPQRVALPCAPVELLIRKQRLVPVTRVVTPTPEGVPVKVALAKPTFLVKVSSTPEGATIMLYGKQLGVTPTTVKVPAFESSTLNITKDGYEPETEKVAPKANGGAVHTVLRRIERKKPR